MDTPTRSLHSHKVNPANDTLSVDVLDNPGAGGACHRYRVSGMRLDNNPSAPQHMKDGDSLAAHIVEILFQNGPIADAGVNGVTQEALLAIVIDRLESFQAGPYACRENALALTKLQEAQHWLHHRTKARMDRGVEGTHEK